MRPDWADAVPERDDSVLPFLAASGWGGAQRMPLAGDASGRRYERLRLGNRSAILMICPAEAAAVAARFERIAAWLRSCGFSAPQVWGRTADGLLICEDFGDALFSRILAAEPDRADALYLPAVGVLAAIGRFASPDGLEVFDAERLCGLVREVAHWYTDVAPARKGAALSDSLEALLAGLRPLDAVAKVTSLRDFHAGNLVWLGRRRGLRRVGLLDFQDAVLAHPAYDLFSLLSDARLDVPEATRLRGLRAFADETGTDPEGLQTDFRLIGVQRCARILGIFARLARRDRKPVYLEHCPRVWAQMTRNADAVDPRGLGTALRAAFPEPDDAMLSRLREAVP